MSVKIERINKEDIINRLLLEADMHLSSLFKAMETEDEQKITSTKEELNIIHQTLDTLGHWKQPVRSGK